MFRAVLENDFVAVQKLLDADEDVNNPFETMFDDGDGVVVANRGYGVLFYVQSVAMTELLLRAGAKVDVREEGTGFSVLHEQVDPKIMELLLEAGADPNAVDLIGNTPLFHEQSKEAALLLLKYGADVNKKNRNGISPLLFFCERLALARPRQLLFPDHLLMGEIIKVLVDHGADVNTFGWNGKQPVHYNLPVDIFKLLIQKGADVNARTIDGYHPLHAPHVPEVIKMLIDAGADVNARDMFQSTPLFALHDKLSLRYLLEAGADLNTVNVENKKAFERPEWKEDQLKLFWLYGAVMTNHPRYWRSTVLEAFCGKRKRLPIELIKLLKTYL